MGGDSSRVGGRGGLIRGAGLDPPLSVDPNSRDPAGPGPSPLLPLGLPSLVQHCLASHPRQIFWNHAGTDSCQPHRRSSNHLAFVAYCQSHCSLWHLLACLTPLLDMSHICCTTSFSLCTFAPVLQRAHAWTHCARVLVGRFGTLW